MIKHLGNGMDNGLPALLPDNLVEKLGPVTIHIDFLLEVNQAINT